MAKHEPNNPEQHFLTIVEAALAEFARSQGLDPQSDEPEIAIPSASLDAGGNPRFTMRLPASLIRNDLGAAHVFYKDVAGRGFEFAIRRFLDVHLQSDDVFIDVGAHWGIHSLTAATVLPGQVSVLAIEPFPENHARLRSWIDDNQLDADIEVVATAIGDREGAAKLWVSGSSMGHTLRTDAGPSGSATIDVGVTTVDRLVAERAHLHWRRVILKIDVEGCELEALTGARELFSSGNIAAVIWEKARFFEPAVQERRDDAIFDFLNARGFAHFRIEDENLGGRLLALEGKEALCNVFSLAPGFDRQERYG